MNLKETLQNELKEAMRSGDHIRKDTIRMILSNIKLMEVDQGPLDDVALSAVLQKEIKMRKEAIEDAKKADRVDLIEANQAELQIVETFLPKQLSEEDLTKIVESVIEELGATNLKEMGAVMKVLLPKIAGRAPNATISAMVRERLAS